MQCPVCQKEIIKGMTFHMKSHPDYVKPDELPPPGVAVGESAEKTAFRGFIEKCRREHPRTFKNFEAELINKLNKL